MLVLMIMRTELNLYLRSQLPIVSQVADEFIEKNARLVDKYLKQKFPDIKTSQPLEAVWVGEELAELHHQTHASQAQLIKNLIHSNLHQFLTVRQICKQHMDSFKQLEPFELLGYARLTTATSQCCELTVDDSIQEKYLVEHGQKQADQNRDLRSEFIQGLHTAYSTCNVAQELLNASGEKFPVKPISKSTPPLEEGIALVLDWLEDIRDGIHKLENFELGIEPYLVFEAAGDQGGQKFQELLNSTISARTDFYIQHLGMKEPKDQFIAEFMKQAKESSKRVVQMLRGYYELFGQFVAKSVGDLGLQMYAGEFKAEKRFNEFGIGRLYKFASTCLDFSKLRLFKLLFPETQYSPQISQIDLLIANHQTCCSQHLLDIAKEKLSPTCN